MFAKRLLFSRTAVKLRLNYALRSSSQHVRQNQELSNLEYRLPDHEEKKPTRDPFVKNLFLGNFDTEFLTFPEPGSNERYLEFKAWMKTVEEYITRCSQSPSKLNLDDVISRITEFGVFRSTIDVQYGGLGFSETELVKLTETLSTLPWLGTFFIKNHILPVRLISKYATAEQKEKFLPAIATGTLIPTICVTEGRNKTSIDSINASIAHPVSGTTWILKGKKNFVSNATRANLYLVFAYALYNNSVNLSEDMAISFIRSSQPGVNCTGSETTVGLQNAPLFTVTFDNVEVPAEDIIMGSGDDYNPLVDVLCPGRQCIAPQAVAILRSFLNVLTSHVLESNHFDNSMCELNGVKRVLAAMVASLYSMESMVYYTAAIADEFADQDTMAENAITEVYCANQCVDNILTGMKLIGAKSYLRTEPFIRFLEDALSLVTYDTNHTDSQIYVALLGLQYAGKAMHEDIRKARNLLRNPRFAFWHMFRGQQPNKDWDISGQLHHTMTIGANALERSLETIKDSIRLLFERHGSEITDKHEDLCRITRVITHVYATVATLSRASRSFCIGLRNSNEERNLAVLLSLLASEEIIKSENEIQNRRNINYDEVLKTIVDQLYYDRQYFMSHVLERIE